MQKLPNSPQKMEKSHTRLTFHIKNADDPKTSSMRYTESHRYCNRCKYHYYLFNDLEVDHIIPRANGGQDDDKNLQLLCDNCNK